jgi:hypothetical protein
MVLSWLVAKPQQHEFNFTYSYGPSYFFNDNVSDQRINTSSAIGLNYMYNIKGGVMSFGSGITFCRNDYPRKVDYSGLVHVTQKLWGLNVEALMRLSKKAYLRVGILLNKMSHANINVSYKTQGNGYYGYGYGEMYDGYSSTQLQASACAGMVFPVKVKRRKLKLGFTLQQQGTSTVDIDYYLKHTLNAQSYKILSTKTRPTRLLFSLEIALKREKKKEE